MTHSGWRKPTSGLLQADKLAKAGERESVPKTRAIVAFKRIASHIGARAGELMLIDTLAAFTNALDWEKGARPIVWPSNEYLMQHTGYSRTGIKMCLRRLAELGLIAFKDSSNGKRWGKRDDEGRIIEAYGIDLSPLAARAGEFEAVYAQLQEERLLVKGAKRKITILRRSIRALLEEASRRGHVGEDIRGDVRDNLDQVAAATLHDLWERFHVLLKRLQAKAGSGSGNAIERLIDLGEALEALKDEVVDATTLARNVDAQFEGRAGEGLPYGLDQSASGEEAFKTTDGASNIDPTGSETGPHILITNQLDPVNCKNPEKRNPQTLLAPKPQSPTPPRNHALPDNKLDSDAGNGANGRRQSGNAAGCAQKRVNKPGEEPVDIATIMSSCPEFAEMARGVGGYIRNWQEFHSAADKIRPMVEISPHAWQEAQEKLGPMPAAAAIALITDKYSAGEIASPGGYMRGLIAKAQTGELHLARSFYGRLNENK